MTAYAQVMKALENITETPAKLLQKTLPEKTDGNILKLKNMLNTLTENTDWGKRSEKYDNLDWVNRDALMDSIVKIIDNIKPSTFLDLGTGTGKILKTIKKKYEKSECWGVDNCSEMLNKIENREKFFLVKNNAENLKNVPSSYFDAVTARMVFHHIKDTEKAAAEIHRILKPGGTFIICEGTPPSLSAVEWYTEMFKYKEERHTLTEMDLINILLSANFNEITTKTILIKNCSLNNWLENSGTSPENVRILKKLHYNAPLHIKKAYNMKFINNDCLMDWKFATVYGIKY